VPKNNHCGIGHKICESKKAYSEEYAQQVVDLALLNRRVMLRKYLCQYCEKWHVTSKSKANYLKRLNQYGAKTVS
jgi:hypothetical protein